MQLFIELYLEFFIVMAIPLPLFLKIQPVILAPKALTSIALP